MTELNHFEYPNQNQKIWYPGSFYSDKDWIFYLAKRYEGIWCYSDSQVSKPEWAELMPEATFKCDLDTLSERAKVFEQQFKPEVLIVSNHPGIRDTSDVQSWIDTFTELPEIIVLCSYEAVDFNLNGYLKSESLLRPGFSAVELRKIH
jgi:hypothetical protein